MRAIVAAALTCGLVLAIVAVAWAAPMVRIESGPRGPTRITTPSFDFTVDETATTVECAIAADQATPVYAPCTSPFTQPTPLDDGDYVFWVRATDDQQEPTEESQAFTVDTRAPVPSIGSGQSGPTNNSTPQFAFTVDGSATSVECSVDGGPPVACTSPYTVGAPLADGRHTFAVQASDALGNASSDSLEFTIDTRAPALSIDPSAGDLTSDRTPSLRFTVGGDATTVECWVDQATPVSCTSPYTLGAPLADGRHTFHVRASDALGNQATDAQDFTVDATPPSLSIDSGPDGPTNDRTPQFAFTAGVDATSVTCWVDQVTPVSCASPWTVAAPLSDGRHTFHVRAVDGLGNQLTRTRDFSVDSSAPPLTIDSGPASQTNDVTPSFAFTTDAPRVECAVDQGTFGPCTSPTTYVVGTPLQEGPHTFRVQATSSVGNHAIESRSFTVDTTAPALSITLGPAGTTGDSTPLFQFAAEAGTTVECSIDQGAPAYGPCTGAISHAAVAPLSDGAYTFRVRATDRAGNQTVATRAFTVDTAGPRPDPAPPVTTPVTSRPAPSKPQLLSPFPLVRISGTLTSTGARIRLLTVRASPGTLVRVTVSPACRGRRRSSRRCRVVQAAGTVGRRSVIGFRGLEHAYRSGTVIVVRVWRADRIGKYTRFTIVRGKAPRRVDQCLMPEAQSGSRCPTG